MSVYESKAPDSALSAHSLNQGPNAGYSADPEPGNEADEPAARPRAGDREAGQREHGNQHQGTILVVDDEISACSALAELLRDEGYAAHIATSGEEALEVIDTLRPDVVLTDLKMPGMDGLELLQRAKKKLPESSFLVMTAYGTIHTAVQAIKEGAENYVTKPIDVDSLVALLVRVMEKVELRREALRLRQEVEDRYGFERIVGRHPAMQRLLKQVIQVAPARSTVLIEGESGTGKELIAAAIHHNSRRRQHPFVRLNCAALAETLLESELFGHERGAFTGASVQRQGRFEQADRGTLFLDEVSEISLPIQVKLLRFLQEREFERVGGNRTIRVDVRVVAATNRDLKQMVQEGTFREDLYYRLNVVSLKVPPLRARRSDIPVLAHHFLHRFDRDNDIRDDSSVSDNGSRELALAEHSAKQLSAEAIAQMVAYPWPGNVRELENAIERAVVMSESDTITPADLPSIEGTKDTEHLGRYVPGLTLAELERLAIMRTLDAVGGATAKAAELLGISQRKIQYRLREWGVAKAPSPNAQD